MRRPAEESQYGLWPLVVNAALFIGFAVSFFRPRTRTDWRTLGAFSAFVVALFTEMYGFPLTLHLLWSWLGNRVSGLDPLSHDAGHLWRVFLGWTGDPHFNILHVASNVLIVAASTPAFIPGAASFARAVGRRLRSGNPPELIDDVPVREPDCSQHRTESRC